MNERYAYFDLYQCKDADSIEFKMTEDDASKCSHQGVCDDDVEEVSQKPYIKEQLQNITDAMLDNVIYECGFEDIVRDRHEKECLFIWSAAGAIVDEMYEETK